MKKQGIGGYLYLAFIGLALAILGGLFVLILGRGYLRAKETLKWDETSAVILVSQVGERQLGTSVPVEFTHELVYEYEVGGKLFRGDRLKRRENPYFKKEEKILPEVERWKVGSQVDVFVNPEDPEEALLEHETRGAGLFDLVSRVIFGRGIGGVSTIIFQNDRRTKGVKVFACARSSPFLMKFIVFFRILVIAALGSLLQAEEGKVLDHELSEWKLGKTLFGQDVIPAKLNGKVVVLGYWGAKCSSCLEGMSQLADLDKKYRGEGLRVIGAETHRSDKKKVRQVVVSQKLKFSITAGVKGPISILGLPHVVVFGSDGKLLFSGHPNRKEFEKTVKLAVTEVKNSRKAGVIVEKSRGKASNALGSENR